MWTYLETNIKVPIFRLGYSIVSKNISLDSKDQFRHTFSLVFPFIITTTTNLLLSSIDMTIWSQDIDRDTMELRDLGQLR